MTLSRRAALVAALGAALAAGPALAAEKSNFTLGAFAAAQKAGKSILVEIAAPWCPTCWTQGLILGGLLGEARFNGLQVFTVDFDNQKDIVRSFRAQSQSTLIVFKGPAEVGRSVGDTSIGGITELLARSL